MRRVTFGVVVEVNVDVFTGGRPPFDALRPSVEVAVGVAAGVQRGRSVQADVREIGRSFQTERMPPGRVAATSATFRSRSIRNAPVDSQEG